MAWAWYDTDWLYFVKVTVDHTKVPNTDQLNYPALITEANMPAAFWRHVKADGTDIVVTSSDGATKLKRELVSIDTAGKKMELWVKIPTLSESVDTVLYLYYGNAAASETNDVETWNDNFKLITHMEDDPDASHVMDSTQYGNDGTKTAADEPLEVGGKIGKGQESDGFDDQIQFPYSALLQPDAVHIGFWIKLTEDPNCDGLNNWRWILSVSGVFFNGPCFLILEQSRSVNFTVRVGGVTYRTIGGVFSSEILTVDEWTHLSYGYDPVTGDGYAYKNFVLSRSGQMVLGGGVLDDTIGAGWRISNERFSPCPNESGSISAVFDELHISDIIHDTDWIDTRGNNQDDPASFYSVGAEFSYLFPFIITPLTSDEVKAGLTSDEIVADLTGEEVKAGLTTDGLWNWLSGWDKRIKIILDHEDIDAALTNFPHLVYLSASSGHSNKDMSCVFDELGSDANRKKIAITKADGITQCYVEIEKWDDANEKAWLWVKVPSVASGADTELYLYYDSTHADNNAHVGITNSAVAENVWDPDFLMVQHQAGDSSPIRDSTSNDIDMTEGGDPTYLQVGPIDGEIDYDGNDYHLSAINVFDAIVGTDKGTMSLWIKTTDSDAVNAMVVLSIEGAYMINFRPGEGGLLKTYWSGTQADAARTTTQINTGAQFYIVSTYDGANQRVYVNGVLETTDACNLYDITGLNRATGLGSHYTGTFNINANIDDVRVSKTDRSAAWIKASYESGRDHLNNFGVEQLLPSPLSVILPVNLTSSEVKVSLR